jgi:hypothetical protein
MSLIKLPLKFEGAKGDDIFTVLFDGNNVLSFINESKANTIAYLITLFKPRRVLIKNINQFVEIKNVIVVDFFINNIQLSDEFFVVPNLSADVIIGEATMRKWRMKLDFDSNKVIVDPKVEKLQLI